ncbi:Phage P2 GpU family protein (fragment) [Xanthomonas citri pv. citri]
MYGPYVLLAVNETATLFFPDGTPRRVEFQLSLRRTDDVAPEATAA